LSLSVTMYSCTKGDEPTLSASEVTEIKGNPATCGGTIIIEGSGTIIERGVCCSRNITPTIDDKKTIDSSGAGSFISNISDLEPVTTYYVRAYATNKAGTGYGMAMSFNTLGSKPSATVRYFCLLFLFVASKNQYPPAFFYH